MLNVLNNASAFQALESSLKKLRPDLTGAGDHAADGDELPYLGGGQFPQLLNQGEVVEGDVDVLVRIVVGDEGRAELHDKPLASALQVRLESEEFVGDGPLEYIIEAHHMCEVDVHGVGVVRLHRLHLSVVIGLSTAAAALRLSEALEEVEKDLLDMNRFLVDTVSIALHFLSEMNKQRGISGSCNGEKEEKWETIKWWLGHR